MKVRRVRLCIDSRFSNLTCVSTRLNRDRVSLTTFRQSGEWTVTIKERQSILFNFQQPPLSLPSSRNDTQSASNS